MWSTYLLFCHHWWKYWNLSSFSLFVLANSMINEGVLTKTVVGGDYFIEFLSNSSKTGSVVFHSMHTMGQSNTRKWQKTHQITVEWSDQNTAQSQNVRVSTVNTLTISLYSLDVDTYVSTLFEFLVCIRRVWVNFQSGIKAAYIVYDVRVAYKVMLAEPQFIHFIRCVHLKAPTLPRRFMSCHGSKWKRNWCGCCVFVLLIFWLTICEAVGVEHIQNRLIDQPSLAEILLAIWRKMYDVWITPWQVCNSCGFFVCVCRWRRSLEKRLLLIYILLSFVVMLLVVLLRIYTCSRNLRLFEPY